MRRFSFMIFALTVLFAIVGGRKDHAERASVNQPASANADGATAEPSSGPSGRSVAEEQSGADGALLKTVAILEQATGASGQAEQSGFITSAPAHIPASSKAGGIDPSVEGAAGGDLNAAAQSELKRLGCYEAKVDGKWGRKSKAAVKAFGERAGAAWSDKPRQDLVAALRNYPAAFCTTECEAKTAGGQCSVAAVPGADESDMAGKDTSYLPPWMQSAKLNNLDEPQADAPGDPKTLPDAAPLTSKPKKSKSVRRRGGERDRAAQRQERRRFSNREWQPEGWPRAR